MFNVHLLDYVILVFTPQLTKKIKRGKDNQGCGILKYHYPLQCHLHVELVVAFLSLFPDSCKGFNLVVQSSLSKIRDVPDDSIKTCHPHTVTFKRKTLFSTSANDGKPLKIKKPAHTMVKKANFYIQSFSLYIATVFRAPSHYRGIVSANCSVNPQGSSLVSNELE